MSLHTFKMSDQIKNMTAKRCALKTGKRGRKNELLVRKIMAEMQMRGKCSMLRSRPNFKS